MTWQQREWLVLKLLKRKRASSGQAIFVDPVILRALIKEADETPKTAADIDALLKEMD